MQQGKIDKMTKIKKSRRVSYQLVQIFNSEECHLEGLFEAKFHFEQILMKKQNSPIQRFKVGFEKIFKETKFENPYQMESLRSTARSQNIKSKNLDSSRSHRILSTCSSQRRRNIPTRNGYSQTPEKKEKRLHDRQSFFNVFGQNNAFQKKSEKSLKSWNMANLVMNYYYTDPYSVLGEQQESLQSRLSNLPRNLKELKNVIMEMLTVVQLAKSSILIEEQFEEQLGCLLNLTSESKNSVLNSIVLLDIARLYQINNKIFNAVLYFKNCKNQIRMKEFWEIRMKAYQGLAECFIKLNFQNLSQFYANKMMQSAWFLNNHKYELKAYDLIGLSSYYTYNMKRARYYHERALQGTYEEQDSDIKKLGAKKVQRQIISIALKMQNRKVKPTIRKKPKVEIEPSEDIPYQFYVSSSDEELIELPVQEIHETIDVAKLGIEKRLIQNQQKTKFLLVDYEQQQKKKYNSYMRQHKDEQESQQNQNSLYYAFHYNGSNKVFKNCNLLLNLNFQQQFNHLSFGRDLQNYEVQKNNRTENQKICEPNERQMRRIFKILNKLQLILNQCLVKAQAVHETQSKKRRGIALQDHV